MYRIMYCKTLNALGEAASRDFNELRDVIRWLKDFRSLGIEDNCAGYSVYELDERGGLGKTLLNWQHDGDNIFGTLSISPLYTFTARAE